MQRSRHSATSSQFGHARPVMEALEDRLLLSTAFETSWVGNTYGMGGQTWVQHQIFDTYVKSDGTLYTNSHWDEGGREAGMYKDGQVVGKLADTHSSKSGQAIAGNATHIFIGMYNGTVRRYNFDGTTSSGRVTVTTNPMGPTGLYATATDLYISDPAANLIKVYDPATLTLKSSFAFTRPGQIAMGPDNTLWIIETSDGTSAPVVRHVSTSGQTLSGTLTVGSAVDVTFDPQGRLVVADNGPDQQIKFYTISGGTLTLADTLGVQGGILAGTPGEVAPDKLNGVTSVAVGADGTVYVSCTGMTMKQFGWKGEDLRVYTPDKQLDWQLYGLEFVDMGEFDPASETDFYTNNEHFTLDWSKPVGHQWTYKGYMIDPISFPDDPRLHIGGDCTWVRRINGQKFLYITDMYAGDIQIYRFDSTAHGEIAIPSGLITKNGSKLGWTPPGMPTAKKWIWRDANGDGQFQANEYDALDTGDWMYNWAWGVDANGNIQTSTEWNTRGLDILPMQGLDSHGNPIYTFASVQNFGRPAPLWSTERVEYDVATDTMWLTGFAAQHDLTAEWGRVGDTIARYDNWSQGNRTASVVITLPYSNSAPLRVAKSFCAEGNYVFAAYFCAGQDDYILVYNATTGALVETLTAGPEVNGVIGDVDIPYGVTARLRANGEYVVAVEDDRYDKIVLYRWRPGNQTPTANVDSATTTMNTAVSINVTANDTDPDTGDSVNVYTVTAPANGTAVRSGAQILYTPATGWTGADSFTYTVSDGHGGTSTATVNVTVSAASVNLALGKTATADSSQTNFGPEKANDGSTSTRWCAANSQSHWWQVDLGQNASLSSVQTVWENNATYKYRIEVSADGATWTTAVDQSANATQAQTTTDTFTASGRYVRVVFLSAGGYWGSIRECRVYGTLITVPAAPDNLSAAATSSSQINLTWADNSTDETGFKIERATDSGFTQNLTLVTTTAANVTSYSDTGLSASTTYYYRVRATNASGDSANSNTATATTQAVATNLALGKTATADSAQTNYGASKANDGSTSTRWCAADGAMGHWWQVDLGQTSNLSSIQIVWEKNTVYKYNVLVSADGVNWTTAVDQSANTTQAQTTTDSFTASTRYVRVVVLGASGYWASACEVRVFGTL